MEATIFNPDQNMISPRLKTLKIVREKWDVLDHFLESVILIGLSIFK